MMKAVRDLKEYERRKKREAGRQGGLTTVARHGVDHMRRIGKRGAEVMHSLYRFAPVGTSQFALVHRETNEVKAFLDGMPF